MVKIIKMTKIEYFYKILLNIPNYQTIKLPKMAGKYPFCDCCEKNELPEHSGKCYPAKCGINLYPAHCVLCLIDTRRRVWTSMSKEEQEIAISTDIGKIYWNIDNLFHNILETENFKNSR